MFDTFYNSAVTGVSGQSQKDKYNLRSAPTFIQLVIIFLSFQGKGNKKFIGFWNTETEGLFCIVKYNIFRT